MRNLIASGAALLASLSMAASTAADESRGQLTARSFTPLPDPLTITVQPDDNTATNLALAGRMSRELATRGFTVPSAGAAFVLRFDSEIRSNVSLDAPRYQREPSGAADSDMSIGAAGPPDRQTGIANLLSSTPGRGVIGERSSGDYSRPLRYVVNVRLQDARSSELIWQGHARYDSERTNATPILEAMVPLLVGEIGETVRDRRFSLE